MEEIKKRLQILVSVFVLGYLLFVFCTVYIINIIKVNGVIYKEIVAGEKLIADILPPPGYIVETHQYIQSVNSSTIKVSKSEYVRKITEFENEYNRTVAKWKYEDSELLHLFIESNNYVQKYYEEAKMSNNGEIGEGSALISIEKMNLLNKLFFNHKRAIENIISYQKEKNMKMEKKAEIRVKLIIFLIIIVALIILIAVIMMSLYLGKKIIYYNNALNKLMEEKDRFYSVISHDLRGPVGNISELLKNIDEFEGEDKATIIEELKKISKKTFELLNDLLEWSKIQQNRTEKQICSVEEIITDTLELFNEMAKQKGIIIKREITEFHIEINERVLKTVLRNIISNAIKYTKREGEVVIKSEIDEKLCRISIKDNGIGMNRERLNEIENKKVVASFLGTEKEAGSGFGLILCRDFIEKSGGKLKVYSEKDNGTEVVIEFIIK